jgi:hypothetical protein
MPGNARAWLGVAQLFYWLILFAAAMVIVIAVTIFAALLLIRAAVGCLADVVIIVSVFVQGPRVFKLALLVGALD